MEKLTFNRLTQSESEFNKTYTGGFGEPECWKINVRVDGEHTPHIGIMQNWVDGIVKGTPLIAPGEEGIKGLEISNAMHLSAWINQMVQLPVDPDLYYEKLQEKIANSTVDKKNVSSVVLDVAGTH